jgi:hypothetical protein
MRLCFDRIVPSFHQPGRRMAEARMLEALSDGEAGEELHELDANADGPISTMRMALVSRKMWENGRTLNCRFLDGSPTQRKKVARIAKGWEQFANITFKFIETGAAEIRISFSADPGSWSAVGTDSLIESYFPLHQPTMNFGWLQDDTEDEEYNRVVLHEFGHALGCIHEHQAPKATLQWDKPAVYRYFSGPPNFWSKEDIDHNVLERYGPSGMKFTRFDPDSIMLYMFDGNLFKNGKPTNDNKVLSKGDKDFIARMYPRATAPRATAGSIASKPKKSRKSGAAKAARAMLF